MLNLINSDLQIDFTEVAIGHTHRIGDPKKQKKKTRPIIAKLVRYNDRKEAFSRKKHLKGKSISITERLTSFKMKKLEKAQAKYDFKQVWTGDGRILFKNRNNNTSVYYGKLA